MTLTVYPNPASEPWAREFSEAIEVPANATWLMLSGIGPQIANPAVAPDTAAAYGDTYTQTRNVLQQASKALAARGYGMGDVVRIVGLVVADGDAAPDFAGFSKAWNECFGTAEQPHIPVRTRSQVTRLVPPGWLVEIEVTAARVK